VALGLAFLLSLLMVIMWLPYRHDYFFEATPEVMDRIGPLLLPTLILYLTGGYLLTARHSARERFEERRRQLDHELQMASRQAELLAHGDSAWCLTSAVHLTR
jgi:hypothetical protein